MKKRIGIGLGFLLALVVIAVLVVPEYRLTLLGYLRGENRFEGRPTSYWRFRVELYTARRPNPAAMNYFEKLLNYLSINGTPERPSVLAGKPEALPVLIDLIREKRSLPVTQEVYKAIGTMGQPSAKQVLPLLEEEIDGQEGMFCRMAAVRALGRLGQEGIPLLIRALKHKSPDVRVTAAGTLKEIGYGPKGSVPKDAVAALVEALEDEVEQVRTSAASALVTIDPDEAEKVHAERFIPRLPGYLGRQ
jgi:hypothetical protein